MEIDITRTLLDQQLIDRHGTAMGRIDGLVFRWEEGQQPVVDHFELGFTVLAERLHPRLAGCLEAIRKRWSVRKEAVYSISWDKVAEVNDDHVKVNVHALETPAFAWELWLRDNVVARIPGAGDESEP